MSDKDPLVILAKQNATLRDMLSREVGKRERAEDIALAALRQIKEAEDEREAALRASHDWMLLRWGEQISPELGRCLDRNKHALAAPLARDIADRALKEMEG